jgi:glutamyl-tRNA synthetase
VCSRRDIAAAASAPHAGEEGPRYPGSCRARTIDAWTPEVARGLVGRAAVRLRTDPGEECFDDAVQGRCCADPAGETGDFVVRRKDGAPAYQLAVVVDDAAMSISHVVRGADLLSSTARQLLLFRLLDAAPPAYLHVPLLLGPDGERLAKRHGAVSLAEARAAGVPPERVAGWLAATCGLAEPGEELAPAALVPRWDAARLPRHPTPLAVADLARLLGRSVDG